MMMSSVVLLWRTVVAYHDDALRRRLVWYTVVVYHDNALRRPDMMYDGSIS